MRKTHANIMKKKTRKEQKCDIYKVYIMVIGFQCALC